MEALIPLLGKYLDCVGFLPFTSFERAGFPRKAVFKSLKVFSSCFWTVETKGTSESHSPGVRFSYIFTPGGDETQTCTNLSANLLLNGFCRRKVGKWFQ